MDLLLFLLEIFKNYGINIAFYSFIILLVIGMFAVILDEDLSDKWRSRFYKITFSILKKKEYEKKYISNDINSKINLARRNMHFGKSLLPKSVKVEWMDVENEKTYDLNEKEFVICLNPANNQEMNIVKLTTAVVKRTTLTGLRHIMPRPIATAIDLNLIRNLLKQIKNQIALDWFFSQEYTPLINKDVSLSNWNKKISEIDERGLFTRILLIELNDFAQEVAALPPRPYMLGEIERLIEFLYNLATRKSKEKTPLDLIMGHIRIVIILVAEIHKILGKGIIPYITILNKKLNQMLHSAYLIIYEMESLAEVDPKREEEFKEIVKHLDETIQQHSLITKDFDVKYRFVDINGNSRKATCIRYKIEKE